MFWTKAQFWGQRKSDSACSTEMAQCFTRGPGKKRHSEFLCISERASQVLLWIEKWLLHCHTCTLIFCITWSTNLGGKCWETLPSKIVSLLRNSQKEEVFHNPQRSRVIRKHKCIRFMCILPSLGPSHPRGAAEAAAVPPSNTSLQCQAQLLWPFLLVGYHAVN